VSKLLARRPLDGRVNAFVCAFFIPSFGGPGRDGSIHVASTPASQLASSGTPGIFARTTARGHEEVVFASDPASGYRGIIAIHSTRIGPALGGTRMWPYASEEEAVTDALRLAEGMTYKAAAAGMPWGGGKAVIWADASTVDRPKLFRAHGRAVERLGGRYITSVDIGTAPDDMRYVQEETKHVAGLPKPFGDPSPATAHGVQRAIEAAAKHVWGRPDLAGRSIAIQGCGHVGYHLARGLHKAGARLVVTDATADRANRVGREFGAQVVAPNEIESARVDVFAPCAFGGGLSARTIPALHCKVVAGAANNQLLTDSDGELIEKQGVVYAPDFITNAGGLIYLGQEVLGWSANRVTAKLDGIFDTLSEVFQLASEQRIPSSEAAIKIAKRRLEGAGTPSAARSKQPIKVKNGKATKARAAKSKAKGR
jgi:leucine dehydrogenase